MMDPHRITNSSSADTPLSLSVIVQAGNSSAPELQNFELVTLPSAMPDEPLYEDSSPIRDSPDDLFSERFGFAPSERPSIDPELDDLARIISNMVLEGLDSADPSNLSFRRGSFGRISDRFPVTWISYFDASTGASLLPDFNALLSMVSDGYGGRAIEALGVERFRSAEVRVLMINTGAEVAYGVFVPGECQPEAVEHFVRALAGYQEPSFLFNAWEHEVVRVMEGDTLLSSEDYLNLLTWIRANLSWTVTSFDRSLSCGGVSGMTIN